MILGLVDRRGIAGADAAAALCAPWSLLEKLAGGLGDPRWRVDVVLVDDEAMTGLNLAYRDAEGPTDVLSFSYLLETGSGAAALAAGERGARCELWLDDGPAGDAEPPLVGEVVLAPAFITGRCRERGWDSDREMALLVVHGCLHILGWEHDEPGDRREMFDLETAVLGGCGLPHPLAEGT